LFYLYVPFRDQDEIPVFDSTQVDLSYAWLFLDNRFTGADRVGDANQITTALTTRLLGAEDGREQLRASVGQIQYFENRQVTLPGTTPLVNPTASRSPLIAEAVWSMTSSWFLRGFVQWDTENNSTRRRGFDRRHHEGDRIFNFAYRLSQQDSLEQVDVSMLWPISSRWRGVGRWNYSLEQGQTIDAIAGFEYDECCWALRFLARSRRDQPDAPSANNSVLFQLELKGLSGVGQRIDRVLQSAIFGYQPTRY
jgi:LPS-assembly protein